MSFIIGGDSGGDSKDECAVKPDLFKKTPGYNAGESYTCEVLPGGRIARARLITQGKVKFIFKISMPGFREQMEGEIGKIRYLRNVLGINFTPELYDHGPLGEEQYFVLQSYSEGKTLGVDETIGSPDLKFSSLISELLTLHGVHPSQESYGYPIIGDYSRGIYTCFRDYIEQRYIARIKLCSSMDDKQKEDLSRSFYILLDHVNTQHRKPCLVHKDCHEGNMIVDWKKSVHLLDFGETSYSFPEQDFARMLTRTYFDSSIERVMHKYEKRSGHGLDPTLIKVFLLCRAVRKLESSKVKNMGDMIYKILAGDIKNINFLS